MDRGGRVQLCGGSGWLWRICTGEGSCTFLPSNNGAPPLALGWNSEGPFSRSSENKALTGKPCHC